MMIQLFPVIRKGDEKNNENYIVSGDIFYADLKHGIGSEQRGYRSVLVIQNNIGKRPSIIVAVITGKTHYKARLPTHFLLKGHCVLSAP
jgi:mRNA interferase MazF